MKSIYGAAFTLCVSVIGTMPLPALAQSTPSAPVLVQTTQSLAGVAVGNGVTQNSPVVLLQSSSRPAIGVGALSGKADHSGTVATVSVANSGRLVGVNVAGVGDRIAIENPKHAPILGK